MKLFNSIKTIAQNRKWIFIFLFLGFAISLHKQIEILLTNSIVKYFLLFFESILTNDILWMISILWILIYYFIINKSYKPSLNILIFSITVAIIYLYYRLYNNVWEFTSLSIIEKIKYFDIILIITIIKLIIYIKNNTQKINSQNKKSFFDDDPIADYNNDDLGYSEYAKSLAEKIMASQFKKSFAIGINAKWGLGKTSFVNLLIKNLRESEIILIHFNVWNNNSPKAIIQDFFENIQEAISPYNSTLPSLIRSYANKLISLNENKITQTIQSVTNIVIGTESINTLFSSIDSSLSEIKKKVIIIIDDIDRLDKYEVLETIRLIRNTASFSNTVFIATYDKNYLVSSLKELNTYRQEFFLEKIIQLEVSLPYFNKIILKKKLAEKLKEQLPDELHSEINNEIIGHEYAFTKNLYFEEWIENIRDITRLSNSIILNYNNLIGEIIFSDFIRLELLRTKYPSVHELLHVNTSFFFILVRNSEENNYYSLSDNKDNNLTTNLEDYLNENYEELSIPKKEIRKIISLIKSIFTYEEPIGYRDNKDHLSVIYPSRFHIYFAYNLTMGSFSEREFTLARNSDYEDFISKINQWILNGSGYELINRFQLINNYDNYLDLEKIIKAIFYIASYTLQDQNVNRSYPLEYDKKDLFSKIISTYNSNNYFDNNTEKERFKSLIQSQLNEALIPYHFVADFVCYANEIDSDRFPFSNDELKTISIYYLSNYCSTTNRLDNYTWRLFYCCTQFIRVHEGSNRYRVDRIIPSEAKEIMQNFIRNNDINGYLLQTITPYIYNDNYFSITNNVMPLFDTWGNFENFILSLPKSNYVDEYNEFYEKFKQNDYKKAIQFEFKLIEIKS